MSTLPIDIPKERVSDFCRRNHVVKLSVFGSALSPRFRPDSDVDMLIEFEADARVTYLDLARMEIELSDLLRRKVDLRTPNELSRYFRDDVVASAVVEYER